MLSSAVHEEHKQHQVKHQQPSISGSGGMHNHTMMMVPPEEVGHEEEVVPGSNESAVMINQGTAEINNNGNRPHHSVATLSSPWQYDALANICSACHAEFHPLNRRHHCRLCGKVYCNDCTRQRALIPPSSIVLIPRGGKKVKPEHAITTADNSDDPDRMLTYLTGGGANANELLYGKGLEERFKLAREPLRVCRSCFQQLAPLQEDLRASNSNAMRFNHIDPTDPRRLFNSPIAYTLGHEIRKAAYTLNNLLPQPKRMGALVPTTPFSSMDNGLSALQACKESCSNMSPNLGDLDGVRIPARLLEQAKGIAVLTVMKGGLGLAGFEFGTGLVVARTAEGWSAPSAISTAGLSWGALIGAQVSDHVFLLMNNSAVHMLFSDTGSVQLGADIGIAVGPLGRAVEGNLGASGAQHVAPIYTYSFSKGLYAGISLDGKIISTRLTVNEKFYGRPVTGMEILAGAVPLPPAAQPLYEALARCHVYASQFDGSNGLARFQHQHHQQQFPPMTTTRQSELLGSIGNTAPPDDDEGEWMFTQPPHDRHYNSQQVSHYHDPYAPLPDQINHDQCDQASLGTAGGMSDITTDPGY